MRTADDYDHDYPTRKKRIAYVATAALIFAAIAASVAIVPDGWLRDYIVFLEFAESASSVLAGLWIVLLVVFVLRKND